MLEESLRLEKLRNFDARSENSGNQQDMFNEAELAEVVEEGLRQYDADDSSEQLDIIPASIRVLVHVRKQHAALTPIQILILTFFQLFEKNVAVTALLVKC